jgi:muramoyltetrapeptide carboxypeptidase
MIRPPFLNKGDKVAIIAPARKISKEELMPAFSIIADYELDVVYSKSLFFEDNQYAGNDNQRASAMQHVLDDESVKAIFFARGGYGSIRIIEKLDFTKFITNPKWLVGYSDITVFHNHIVHNLAIQTLHASMPINFTNNTKIAVNSLFDVLFGKLPYYKFNSHQLNKQGSAVGVLVGGNLSVLYSLLGSISFPDTDGKILFLEDLDEYLYHIDRMMMGLKRAGKLSNLAGLLIGGMVEMNDNKIPFGKTAPEIIRSAVEEYNYPVYFNAPAGHFADNRALIMGRRVKLKNLNSSSCTLTYL